MDRVILEKNCFGTMTNPKVNVPKKLIETMLDETCPVPMVLLERVIRPFFAWSQLLERINYAPL